MIAIPASRAPPHPRLAEVTSEYLVSWTQDTGARVAAESHWAIGSRVRRHGARRCAPMPAITQQNATKGRPLQATKGDGYALLTATAPHRQRETEAQRRSNRGTRNGPFVFSCGSCGAPTQTIAAIPRPASSQEEGHGRVPTHPRGSEAPGAGHGKANAEDTGAFGAGFSLVPCTMRGRCSDMAWWPSRGARVPPLPCDSGGGRFAAHFCATPSASGSSGKWRI